VSLEQIENLVEQIIDSLSSAFEREVPGEEIGRRVMDGLRALDPIAYVRYASVIVDSKKQPTSFRKSKNWRNDMILLRHDCLVFKTSDGDSIPCSAEQVTLEIIGDAIAQLDEQTVKQASAAVLHYFKAELGKRV